MDSMQRDMLSALDFDQKKQQVNDAKLRAVAQRVEYDEFEKLVLGAHLKPVKPRSQHAADTSKPFDCFVLPKYEPKPALGPAMPAAALAPAAPMLPKTSNDFLRVWRRQLKTPEEKFAFLRKIEPECLTSIFRTELEPATFDGMIDAIRVCVLEPAKDSPEAFARDADWTEKWLLHTSKISRFELTLDFAEKRTSATIAGLIDLLEQACAEPSSGRASLRTLYRL